MLFRSALLVVAASLGAYLYFVESKKPVEPENAKNKVFSYETGKIDQLRIKSASGDVTTLKRASNSWTIVSPVAALADQSNVNDVITNLASLEEDRVVEDNAADLKPFGLAEPRIDITFNVAGEKEARRILFGDMFPTGAGLYAKLPGDKRVFLVGSSLDTSLNRSTFDLRDKTALTFQAANVDSIEIASKNQEIQLARSGQDWKLLKPIVSPGDYASVTGLLGQLQSAQMMILRENPEEIKDLKQYGLDKPQVTVKLGTGPQHVTFELGSNAEGSSVWARNPARAAVFTVSAGLADELRKTPFDLRRKEIFEFRPYNTDRFEITRGNDTRAFERVKGAGENSTDIWKQVAPSSKTVDGAALESALLDFSNLRAEAAVDKVEPTTGLNDPVATITVTFDSGKKKEVVRIGRLREDVFAARADQPGALKLEMGKYDAALKKVDAIQ